MSRFAKLVNAQAARTQEVPQESQEQPPPKQVPDKQELNSPRTIEATPADALVATLVNTPVVTPATTPVKAGVTTPVDGIHETQREARPQYLDATHTASEQRVYSVMYRETVSRGVRERHFGPKELCERTGIRSDRTIRTALDGLISKRSVEIVSHFNGSPLGPRYRVFEPKEIVSRRKAARIEIDPQSKKILTPATTPATTPVTTGAGTGAATGDKSYRGTGVDSTGVTGVELAGVSSKYVNDISEGGESAAGSSSNPTGKADDEAYAQLLSRLQKGVKDVTGKESGLNEAERWGELADLLVTELKIAAGRTGSVSSVPAFLTEHLRRRLWKKEKRQIEAEVAEHKASAPDRKIDPSKCPDCFGTGMYYPEGFEKGVAKCPHSELTEGNEG